MRYRKSIIFALGLISLLFLVYCNERSVPVFSATNYLNLHDTVDYVGMNTCRSCHYNIHETYQHTGMGRSFDYATREKSDATYGAHALVYHEEKDLYYKPFFQDSTLYITEFRLEEGDTIFQRTEKMSYIVGSGQHTNSHILDINGYIYQAPITYYTQDGKWDMAPGFRGSDLRFDRWLATECITCHNHFPKHVVGSMNKYEDMPRGIECERCHGPGEAHVNRKMAGELIDTARFVDYSIVNPKKLPRDRQMDLCQRCHLQGVAVLEDGKSFFDFKPGMALSEVLNVFLPRYTNSHEKFIMASQADRLRLSPCYLQSETLSCITCHNPHHSVESTDKNQYNRACQSCHQANSTQCSAAPEAIAAENNNCISCHMPRSGSIDIPHVNITDHYISKQIARRPNAEDVNTMDATEQSKIARFLGLEILTKSAAEPLEMAQGYLALYDKYVDSDVMLDSAKWYLDRSQESPTKQLKTKVHYLFARQDYAALQQLAQSFAAPQLEDGWTAYRFGEALTQRGDYTRAVLYLKRAVRFLPFHLDFQEKLGQAYLSLGNLPQARKTFEFVITENDRRPIALNNLGFIAMQIDQLPQAATYFDQALALTPDYEQAMLNKVYLLIKQEDRSKARQLLNRLRRIYPENRDAQALQSELK